MSRRVGIAELKAHLRHHLKQVRAGRIVTVLDRETPIVQIVRYEKEQTLEVIRATRKPRSLRLPPAPASGTDSLAALLQDRASR